MPGKDYFKVKIDRMVNKALAQKEEEFFEAHQNDSDEELLQYLRKNVGGVGHTPRKREFVGWKLIEERFGSVDAATRKAGMYPYRGQEPIAECRLIKEETERQKQIYREKKQEKRRKTEQRKLLFEKRHQEEEAWLAEHDPQKLARKKRKKSKKKQHQGIKKAEQKESAE